MPLKSQEPTTSNEKHVSYNSITKMQPLNYDGLNSNNSVAYISDESKKHVAVHFLSYRRWKLLRPVPVSVCSVILGQARIVKVVISTKFANITRVNRFTYQHLNST